jgi:hypothetical protein
MDEERVVSGVCGLVFVLFSIFFSCRFGNLFAFQVRWRG